MLHEWGKKSEKFCSKLLAVFTSGKEDSGEALTYHKHVVCLPHFYVFFVTSMKVFMETFN